MPYDVSQSTTALHCVEEQQTIGKLTKLYENHESAHQAHELVEFNAPLDTIWVISEAEARAKPTICTFKAKKVEGTTQKFFRRFAPNGCPHFRIRSGATAMKCFTLK